MTAAALHRADASAPPAAPTAAAGDVWQCGAHALSLRRQLIMGIVNVTPDSFSDGGRYASADAAYAHGMEMLQQGAAILDVGGESTRPNAAPVPAEEEKRRVLPVIERLAAAGAVVSADTMKAEVMRAAANAGASILNDVRGFESEAAIQAAAKSGCGLVIMHMQGEPRTMQRNPVYDDVVSEVGAFLRARAARLRAAGAAAARLCIDAGIGFGKTRAHNVALMNGFFALSAAAGGAPVLAGVSRKSLFADIAPGAAASERDGMSAVAAALLAQRGASVLRVHNVAMTRQALAVRELLAGDDASGAAND